MTDIKKESKSVQLLSITDAARFLGYKTNRPVSKLIQSNALPTYTLPDSKRRRIKMSDLLKLIQLATKKVEIPVGAVHSICKWGVAGILHRIDEHHDIVVVLHAENRGCLADSPFNRESLSRSFSLWKLWLCINCALFMVFP